VADLAVLPFRVLNAGTGDITPDGGGLAYMIAGELARNPDLRIISTLVTTELRGKDMSLSQIGATTHARYLVDGSVERRGDRLQLDAQLIDGGDSRIVWSGRFEPTAQDLPGVVQALIERIGGSLGATVRELDRAALLNRAPASLDAHERYCAGSRSPGRRVPRAYVRRGRSLNRRSVLTRITPPHGRHLGWTKQLLIFGNHDPTSAARICRRRPPISSMRLHWTRCSPAHGEHCPPQSIRARTLRKPCARQSERSNSALAIRTIGSPSLWPSTTPAEPKWRFKATTRRFHGAPYAHRIRVAEPTHVIVLHGIA